MNFTKILQDFPILDQVDAKGQKLCFLDSAATSQKPIQVIEAMNRYYLHQNANIHRGVYHLSEEATTLYEGAREKIRAFIHARGVAEIIYTRNTTEAINLVAYTWGRKNLKSGDTIILTEMEHHSNHVPWIMLAEELGVELRFIPVLENGELDWQTYDTLLKEKPKLVAMSGMSNVMGTILPIKALTRKAHEAGAIFLLDAAQLAPHMALDVQLLDVDFAAFSAHKMLGPTGIGILYGKESLLEAMPPFLGGGDMISKVHLRSFGVNELPHKFEAGTPAIAEAIGFGAAVDYLTQVGMDNIFAHEEKVTEYALQHLSGIPGLRIIGPTSLPRGSAVSFTLDYAHPHDVAQILDGKNICVRAGHHCAMPLHERFQIPATTRASFYLYNTEEEADRLCEGLMAVHRIFG